MKTCTKCSIEKEDSDFYVKNKKLNKLHSQCKDCCKEGRNFPEHYEKYKESYKERAIKNTKPNKQKIYELFYEYMSNKKCSSCGEDDPVVLEFHHRSQEDKEYGISRMVNCGYSWDRILLEISKCDILCANCHRKETAKQLGWRKYKIM